MTFCSLNFPQTRVESDVFDIHDDTRLNVDEFIVGAEQQNCIDQKQIREDLQHEFTHKTH